MPLQFDARRWLAFRYQDELRTVVRPGVLGLRLRYLMMF